LVYTRLAMGVHLLDVSVARPVVLGILGALLVLKFDEVLVISNGHYQFTYLEVVSARCATPKREPVMPYSVT